ETVFDTLLQVREREPARPGGMNGRVDRDLETVCLKCLRKEPGQRYASAEALADDLERWLAGEPIHARPIGRPTRLWRWCRRNPPLAARSGLAAAALIVTVIGLSVSTGLIWVKKKEADSARADAEWQGEIARGQTAKAEARKAEAEKAKDEAEN